LELGVGVAAGDARRADDQRRAGFVDQDGVDFVDDGVVQLALAQLVGLRGPCCRAGSQSRIRCWCRRYIGGIGFLAGAWLEVAEALVFVVFVGKFRS
jgi:hypothetical protein